MVDFAIKLLTVLLIGGFLDETPRGPTHWWISRSNSLQSFSLVNLSIKLLAFLPTVYFSIKLHKVLLIRGFLDGTPWAVLLIGGFIDQALFSPSYRWISRSNSLPSFSLVDFSHAVLLIGGFFEQTTSSLSHWWVSI
jgi:hypothetical protein